MPQLYLDTFENIIILFAFILTGYLLRRKNILPLQSGRTLSVILVNVFLPALIFNNLSNNLKRDALGGYLVNLLAGAILLAVVLAVARILAIPFNGGRENRNLLTYIFAFPNFGYFGYPLIQSVFGDEMLARTIVFAIPFSIAIYTLGIYLLVSDGKKEKRTLAENIKFYMSPIFIALFAGVVVGLSGVNIPVPVSEGLSLAGACLGPVAMILTGFVLGAYPAGELFSSAKAYAVSAVRLILIPVVFAAVLYLSGLEGNNFFIPVMMFSMPVGMNIVVFGEANGKDSKTGARICFVSYIMGIITIPVLFMTFQILAGL